MLRRCRETVSGLPRTAVLRYRRRPVTESPRYCIFRHQLMKLPELPRFVHPPVSPERIFGSPRIFFGLWLLRRSWPQFALALRSFGGAEEHIPGSPRFSVLQRGRRCFLGLPRLTSTVGSMMNPVCSRTLHPRLAPRMNLQVQSGFAVLPESGDVSISSGSSLSASRPRTPVVH